MPFLSLYRKYRPQKFTDLVGQKPVVRTLKNALEHDRISHAYLFAGPRGTGKTSSAKVLAMALNCEQEGSLEPCGDCQNCQNIRRGRSVDVVEIDAASNRGIDEIRELRERVKFYPGEGEYKVYIIDEVHMLTKGAFNALLKTLEEPPENVVFVLATTEPHRVMTTIHSRCQRLDFSLLSIGNIEQRLNYICRQEEVDCDPEALNLIAHSSAGGMRDAISILDQAISYTGGEITAEAIRQMLGKIEIEILSEFINYLATNDSAGALQLVNEVVDRGQGVDRFVEDMVEHTRQLLLLRECGPESGLLEYPQERIAVMKEEADRLSLQRLRITLRELAAIENEIKYARNPRLLLELVIIKIVNSPEKELATRVEKLEKKLKTLLQNGGQDAIIDKKEAKTDKMKQKRRTTGKKRPAKSEKKDTVSTSSGKPGQIDIGVIREYWSKILSAIKEKDIKTHAFLIEGKPVKLSDNRIIIQFPPAKDFHKKGAEKKGALIRSIINGQLDKNFEPVFVIEGEDGSDSGKKKVEKEETDKNEDISTEKLVREVARMFSGEIIKANPEVIEKKEVSGE